MIGHVRRRQALLGVVAFLPALTGLLLLRPAPAQGQDAAIGFFALTVTAASTNTSGDVGAGGGLAPVDTGAPVVKGRLDSSPTASMIAAAVEPGTLYRTAAALANNEAGDEVVPVEFAEAAFPGGPEEDVSDPTATGVQGPFASGTVQARVRATDRAISGAARVSEQAVGAGDVPIRDPLEVLHAGLADLALRYPTAMTVATADPDLLRQKDGHAEATATGDPAGGTLVASSTSTAASISIAGLITIEDVHGHAVVRWEDGRATADAATTYGGATIAGVPVALTTDGVVVADDTPLLPAQEVAVLEDQLNAVLEAAGIVVAPISPIEKAGGGDAVADSGGIRVAITTPSSAAVPANVVDIVVAQAVATLAAEPPSPPPPPLPGSPGTPATPAAPQDPSTSAPESPVDAPARTGTPVTVAPARAPTTPASPDVAPPQAGPPVAEPNVVLAGRPVPRRAALALFGGWQLLSLSTCTLAAFALRGGQGQP